MALHEDIRQKLCDYFDIECLKPHQIDALEQIIIEKRDTLIVLPTGSGKSLCFKGLTEANRLIHTESAQDVLSFKSLCLY